MGWEMGDKAGVRGISQGVKAAGAGALLTEARGEGRRAAEWTGRPASPLAEQGDVVFNLGAGDERAVAATKTYTAELAAVALLSVALGGAAETRAALWAMPDAVAATLAMQESIAAVAPRYRYMSRCVVIGRGYNYATAFETALKLKELTYTIVEPYSSADFLHGPLAMLEPGFPVIVIAPAGLMAGEAVGFVHTLRERQAEVIAISDDAGVLAAARVPLALPSAAPAGLSPPTALVPRPLLALHLAHPRDLRVAPPRALRTGTHTVQGVYTHC